LQAGRADRTICGDGAGPAWSNQGAHTVILRLWRGRLQNAAESALLERLRQIAPLTGAAPGPTDFTYGFRQESGRTMFLALSVWPDYASVTSATAGDISQTVRAAMLDDLLEDYQSATYEDLASSERVAFPEGRVLGVVTGRVKPQHEAAAQEMVDRSSDAALRAGALAAHLGRRLDSDVAELAIAVVWPRREAMTRFVRSRNLPAIDPAFAAHLSSWRFETYTALDPERLTLPAEGPGVLIVDLEGRFADSTPGVENVLGVPGELLQGRSILDLAPTPKAAADFRRRFLETAVSHGTVDLLRPDGEHVRARYRSVEGVPGPGLRSVVLALPEELDDPRPTADIVLEALGMEGAFAS
jgi:PAS domain-containing protein